MTKMRILTPLLVPLLLVSMAAYSYGHFTDFVENRYKLHAKCLIVEIKSYKVLSKYDDDLIEKVPSDDMLMDGTSTLSISTDTAFPGWWVWIGLLIKNQGGFPADVYELNYDISDPSGVGVYTEEYFYGPHTGSGFMEVWGHIRWQDLQDYGAPDGYVEAPVTLQPEEKTVVWIYLELSNGPTTPPDFEVEIRITIHAEFT